MTTANPTTEPTSKSERLPLRLLMSSQPGEDRLDGGWWPQSRDLVVELADLVDNFPAGSGRIMRALYSPPDWDTPTRRIPVARGYVKVGSFPGDDTHLIQLRMADRSMLHVLVIPPRLSAGQGEEALLAAATPGNSHTGSELLDLVTDSPDVDPAGHWS